MTPGLHYANGVCMTFKILIRKKTCYSVYHASLAMLMFAIISVMFVAGVTLTLSAAIDGQNFNAGGHKVGVALELEP